MADQTQYYGKDELPHRQFSLGLGIRRWIHRSETTRQLTIFAIFVVGILVLLAGDFVIGKTSFGVFVVLGLFSVAGGVMMVIRPDIGMFILVASVYSNSSDVMEVAFGIPSTNKLLVAVTFLSVIGTRAIIQKQPLRFGVTEMAIAFYMVVAIVSLFVAGEVGEAFDSIIDFAKDFAIVIIIVQLCGDELTWKRMIWVLIGTAGILGSMTVYQTATGNYEFEFWGWAKAPVHEVVEGFDSARPTGPLDDPNYYSQLLLMIQPMAFYRWYTERKWKHKLWGFFFWAMIVLTALFSYSRGAFVTLMFILGVIVLERRMNILQVGLAVAFTMVAVTPLLPEGYSDRLATLTGVFQSSETQTEASFEGRTSEALAALMMFQDNFLTGIGYSMYEENYMEYSIMLGIDGRLEARSAHSMYLEVMAETGIIGITSFVVMVGTFYYVSQKAIADLSEIGRDDLVPWIRGVQLGFLSYMMTSIFLHDDWVRFFRLGLAIMASCSVVADSVIERHKKQLELEKARHWHNSE